MTRSFSIANFSFNNVVHKWYSCSSSFWIFFVVDYFHFQLIECVFNCNWNSFVDVPAYVCRCIKRMVIFVVSLLAIDCGCILEKSSNNITKLNRKCIVKAEKKSLQKMRQSNTTRKECGRRYASWLEKGGSMTRLKAQIQIKHVKTVSLDISVGV